MECYFAGSKLVKKFYYELDEGNQVAGQIHASWLDTGMGQTSHCGVDSEFTIEDTYGITDAEVERIEEEMGFQFGIPNISQIKNGIKQSSDNTITFNKQVKTGRKFIINSDKCGSTCIKLFKKILIVDLTYYRNRGFLRGGIKKTQSQFREETQHVDCQVSRRELTDECGCDDGTPKSILRGKSIFGNVRLSWGCLSILSPFSLNGEDFVTDVGNLEIPLSLPSNGEIRVVDRNVIPELYRFLSRDNSERYRIQITPDVPEGVAWRAAAYGALSDAVQSSAAMSPEREKLITAARMLQELGIFPSGVPKPVADISET